MWLRQMLSTVGKNVLKDAFGSKMITCRIFKNLQHTSLLGTEADQTTHTHQRVPVFD